MTTPAGLYPFATQDGRAIPLDIIKPLGLILQDVFVGSSLVTIPETAAVAFAYASKDSMLSFGINNAVPADNVLALKAIFLPANTLLTIAVEPGAAYVRLLGEGQGKLTLQFIEKWAGLGLSTQFTRK